MSQQRFAIGIDIGGTNTKLGILNPGGELLAYHHLPTSKSLSAEQFIEQLAQESQQLFTAMNHPGIGDSSIRGLAAGAPMANYMTGEVDYAPNLGWRDVPLKRLFEKYFKTPAQIENDANLAAIGEKKWGAGKSLSDFVLITLGTGVGSGLILGGKLYRGSQALGGEGGHVLIPHTKHRLCSCGGMDHVESYLSAKGIKQTIEEMTQSDLEIKQIGELFRQGDAQANAVMNQIALELGRGLASIGVILGPQAFVLGGGVSQLGLSFNELVRQKMDEEIHFSLRGKIQILTASLAADKGAVYGGAAMVFDEEEM